MLDCAVDSLEVFLRPGLFRDQAAGGGKRERTRAALLDATVRIVADKGVEALKISDITTLADLANGTFYNHFTDKDEILREAAHGIAVEVSRQLDAEMEGIEDAPTRVVKATAAFIDISLSEPDWAAIMLASADRLPEWRDDAVKYLRSDLQRGVDQKKFDVNVNAFLIRQIIALITVAIMVQLDGGVDRKITRQACESILRLLGMSPAKSHKAVEGL